MHGSSRKVPVILARRQPNLNSWSDSENFPDIEFHDDPSSGSQVVQYGRAKKTERFLSTLAVKCEDKI